MITRPEISGPKRTEKEETLSNKYLVCHRENGEPALRNRWLLSVAEPASRMRGLLIPVGLRTN